MAGRETFQIGAPALWFGRCLSQGACYLQPMCCRCCHRSPGRSPGAHRRWWSPRHGTFCPSRSTSFSSSFLSLPLFLLWRRGPMEFAHISIYCAVAFGAVHALLAFGDVPLGYVIRFMISAAAFGFIFPYLLLRVPKRACLFLCRPLGLLRIVRGLAPHLPGFQQIGCYGSADGDERHRTSGDHARLAVFVVTAHHSSNSLRYDH